MLNLLPHPKYCKTQKNIRVDMRSGEIIKTNYNRVNNFVDDKFGCNVIYENNPSAFYLVLLNDQNSKFKIPEIPEMIRTQNEGYLLEVDNNYTVILSLTERGLFYGWQTYLQLLQQEIDYYTLVIDFPDNNFRGFHMDLRYGMPNFERMIQIIDRLALYKFNIFILEYENRFQFKNTKDVTDKICYTSEEISYINNYCRENFIELIPLQQTIGHLEYLLKIDKYNHHREVKSFPDSDLPFTFNSVGFKFFNDIDEICASDDKAYKLVKSMLCEIIDAHPDSKYIHIGCDEAWNLVTCKECRNNYGSEKIADLYITHINKMAEIVILNNKIPIIWDDMLRHFSDDQLEKINSKVVIMIWLYYESNRQLGNKLIDKYRNLGFEVLGASAAKCSEGPEPQYLDLPWYSQRINNSHMWGDLCDENHLSGFAVTVWSNYSGTIAPPHPFFDTIWFPVIFTSQILWNSKTDRSLFEETFYQNFFGVKGIKDLFSNNNQKTYNGFVEISKNCKINHYEAKVMEIMSLTSAYRIKSLAINRELYRLNSNITPAERKVIFNRMNEVNNLREYLKIEISEILKSYYHTDEIEIFINSRFETDEILFKIYKEKNHGKI